MAVPDWTMSRCWVLLAAACKGVCAFVSCSCYRKALRACAQGRKRFISRGCVLTTQSGCCNEDWPPCRWHSQQIHGRAAAAPTAQMLPSLWRVLSCTSMVMTLKPSSGAPLLHPYVLHGIGPWHQSKYGRIVGVYALGRGSAHMSMYTFKRVRHACDKDRDERSSAMACKTLAS